MVEHPVKPHAQPPHSSEARLPQGPLKQTARRFEPILSVPVALRDQFFRWQSEFDICERAVSIGQALDVVTEIYAQFVIQFSAVSDIRMRLIQSPSQYMVAPVYYCDRALNSLVHAIAQLRFSINSLYHHLRDVYNVVVQKSDSAEKMYREVEMAAKSDMALFVEERKAKATVFRELADRIRSIREGGASIFIFLDKPWCRASSVCINILGTHPPNLQSTAAADSQAEPLVIENDKSTDKMHCTPEDQPRIPDPGLNTVQLAKTLGGVPETPETKRPPDDEPPVTQVSSPRQRNSSARKRARAIRIASAGRLEGDEASVARNLIADSSHPSDELNVGQELQGNVDDALVNAEKPVDSQNKPDDSPAQEKRQSDPEESFNDHRLSTLHPQARRKRRAAPPAEPSTSNVPSNKVAKTFGA